jgi:23S rRNA pseudouridine2605 synthase
VEERLQKLLAAAGVASRRASEALITSGRVTVNGATVRELGAKADPARDDIRLDGRAVRAPEAHTYLMLHKPAGYTSTVSDPHAKHTVMELLPTDGGRLFPAGRLDRDSEGLLLLTDDGELTQRLLHPRYHLAKEYAVLVRGEIGSQVLWRLRKGTVIEGKRTAPVEVEPAPPPGHIGAEPALSVRNEARPIPNVGGRRAGQIPGPAGLTGSSAARAAGGAATATDGPLTWLRFVLHEGRKRQIRELCTEAGLAVERLIRVRIGPLALGGLPPGKTRRLRAGEITNLRRACGLDAPTAPEVAAIGVPSPRSRAPMAAKSDARRSTRRPHGPPSASGTASRTDRPPKTHR